jgi:hypothetical protein
MASRSLFPLRELGGVTITQAHHKEGVTHQLRLLTDSGCAALAKILERASTSRFTAAHSKREVVTDRAIKACYCPSVAWA